jgi:hypothetical protein
MMEEKSMSRVSGGLLKLLLVLQCAPPIAHAQARTAIQLEPKPGQIVQVTTMQSVSMSGNIGSADRPVDAQMSTETVFVYTQANGRFDERDRMESNLTIQRIELKQTVNGTLAAPTNTGHLVGRSITAVFDRGGKLVDVRVPEDLQQTASVLKQMVAIAYGAVNFLPAASMAIGDTETTPSTIPMRLPGGTTAPYQTQTSTTLRAVNQSGSDRVAHFEQRIESTTPSDVLKVNGGGTIEVNLDRGFVLASETEWSFSGNTGAIQPTTAQSGSVRGTIKVTVAAVPK